MNTKQTIKEKDFEGFTPTWCPGCGDWGINSAIKKSFVASNLDPSQMCIVFGIGCSGNMNDFLNAYAFHGLHGRAMPVAVGIKLANHKLPVLVIAGDGDTYGEGGNHLMHACRGNHDITLIIHDNGVYGLTTGQVAPTAMHGMRAKSTPTGMIEQSISPLSLMISQGATFVAQSFAGNVTHMSDMITKAIAHKGFSVVNILQPCVSFNWMNTYQYYLEKSYILPTDYYPSHKGEALVKAEEMMSERFPLGVIYQRTDSLSYHEQVPALQDGIPLLEKKEKANWKALVKEYI